MKSFGMRGLISLCGAFHFLLSVPCAYAQRELEPVVVTATRQAMKASDVLSDVTTISSEEIRNAGAVSLAELLGRQPGIEFTQNGGSGASASVFIRGSNSNHVLLLVDGVRVGSATLGSATWEFIPLELIDHIEIVRGPVSSLYGSDAIGGVVQIFTKRGEGPARPFFEVGFGSQNTSVATVGVSGGQEGWRYSFTVSDKKSDSINATSPMKRGVANSSYYADLDGYQTSSSSGGLSYSPVNGQEYGFNYIYSEGISRFDTLLGALDRNYTQNQTISSFNLYSRHGLSNIWATTVRVGQSLDDSRNLNNDALSSSYKTIQTHYQIQNDIRLPLGVALFVFESIKQRIDSSDNFKLKDRDIDSVIFGWSGSFGLHRLQSSLRQDRNSQFGSYSSGMLGYGYQLSSNWRSSVSWGAAFKSPTFNDLYYSDIWGNVGNPNLKPENSVNREASVRYESDAQNSSVTYYQNDVSNLIQWEIIDPITEASSPRNVSSAKLTGLTFAHKSNIGKYGIYGSLDLQDPKDEQLNRTLANRSKEILKLGLSRNFGALTLASELMSTGKRFEYNDYPTPNLALYELGGYTLVNLRLNYTASKEWSIFARANNIFDKKYVLVEGYATPGSNLFAGVRYTPK